MRAEIQPQHIDGVHIRKSRRYSTRHAAATEEATLRATSFVAAVTYADGAEELYYAEDSERSRVSHNR